MTSRIVKRWRPLPQPGRRRALAFAALAPLALGCSHKVDPAPYSPDCTEVAGQVPPDLKCTGLFTDFARKTVSPDAKPYVPGLTLYADGAEKSRWLLLPAGAQIDTTDMDNWVFPVGTKVWKEFKLAGKRVETRYYYKQSAAQWIWADYRWSDDESKAPSLPAGEQNVGGSTYEIPDQLGCDKCHRGSRDRLLGVEAVALAQPSAKGVTLASLVADKRLSAPPSATTIVIPEDATGKAAGALGYLHMNCGVSCHVNVSYVEGSESGLFTRLSATQLLKGGTAVKDVDAYKSAVGVPATHRQHYTYVQQGYSVIAPGNSGKSLVVALMAVRDGKEQMPTLGSHVADDQGLALVKGWIDALPPR